MVSAATAKTMMMVTPMTLGVSFADQQYLGGHKSTRVGN